MENVNYGNSEFKALSEVSMNSFCYIVEISKGWTCLLVILGGSPFWAAGLSDWSPNFVTWKRNITIFAPN